MASKERSNDATLSQRIVGWDIGGVNTKVACVAGHAVVSVVSHPFEVRRDPGGLAQVLRRLASRVGVEPGDVHAITMTAELARVFATKREGVAAVLDAVDVALPGAAIHVFGTDGRFRSPGEARQVPLLVASANWMATASLVAQMYPDAILIDTGTTTTDIIPIAGGVVVAEGHTDPDRLASGELVYTGALRTPVEAIATRVTVGGRTLGLAAEGFALSGDVHLWRGTLAPDDYTTPTPDDRLVTPEGAGNRLRRAVCADADLLDAGAVTQMADDLARQQAAHIEDALVRVRARHPSIGTAVVTGLGAFLATEAARATGLTVTALADAHGGAAGRHAPAACVGLLLAQRLAASVAPTASTRPDHVDLDDGEHALARPVALGAHIDVVVKVGGSLLKHPGALDAVLGELAVAATYARVLVVPGGGPFADAVRAVDQQLGLSDEAAHWMAVLAMDQYAHLIVSRVPDAMLVQRPDDMGLRSVAVPALDGVPSPTNAPRGSGLYVLAPSAWLRARDPLPHSWDVTSDSIAAWVAGQVGSRRLVLVKPPGSAGADAVAGAGADAVDAYFATARPPGIDCRVVPADDLERLRAALS